MRPFNRVQLLTETVKVIPQNLNLPMNFFETFHESSLLSTVSKNTIKMIGHHSRLRDYDGPILPHLCLYQCLSRALFIGSR